MVIGQISGMGDSRLWGLDPMYFSHVKIMCAQFNLIKGGYGKSKVLCLYGHVITRVHVVGVIVSKQDTSRFVKYTLDDGTGLIPCILWREHSNGESRLCADHNFELGDSVCVLGRLNVPDAAHLGELEVVVNSVRSNNCNDDILHSLQAITLTRTEYIRPFEVKDFPRCNALLQGLLRADDDRVAEWRHDDREGKTTPKLGTGRTSDGLEGVPISTWYKQEAWSGCLGGAATAAASSSSDADTNPPLQPPRKLEGVGETAPALQEDVWGYIQTRQQELALPQVLTFSVHDVMNWLRTSTRRLVLEQQQQQQQQQGMVEQALEALVRCGRLFLHSAQEEGKGGGLRVFGVISVDRVVRPCVTAVLDAPHYLPRTGSEERERQEFDGVEPGGINYVPATAELPSLTASDILRGVRKDRRLKRVCASVLRSCLCRMLDSGEIYEVDTYRLKLNSSK